MRNKTMPRLLAAFLALVLCMGAFSVTAFAYDGGEMETTGGMGPYDPEPGAAETKDTDTVETSDTEDTGDDPQAESVEDADTLTEEQISDLLSALIGAQGNITVTEDGLEITSGEETKQTGTVTTNGGHLNVRTGAGLDNDAFTQLENGATVEVVGEDGDWIKVLLPERVGYVHSDYLTVAEGVASNGGSFSLSIGEDDISALLELFTGEGGASLTPDGNLTLIDDIGSATAAGKQFITVESKNGNVFYLIIDRDDDGEETVHFLNQVDEADLLALTEDGQAAETPIVCTCTEKCAAGDVDTSCPVCKTNMSECTGKETAAEPEEPAAEKKGGAGAVLAVLLLLGAGGGAAAYFLVVKPKQGKKTSSALDDLDLEEEEEYLNEDETEEME